MYTRKYILNKCDLKQYIPYKCKDICIIDDYDFVSNLLGIDKYIDINDASNKIDGIVSLKTYLHELVENYNHIFQNLNTNGVIITKALPSYMYHAGISDWKPINILTLDDGTKDLILIMYNAKNILTSSSFKRYCPYNYKRLLGYIRYYREQDLQNYTYSTKMKLYYTFRNKLLNITEKISYGVGIFDKPKYQDEQVPVTLEKDLNNTNDNLKNKMYYKINKRLVMVYSMYNVVRFIALYKIPIKTIAGSSSVLAVTECSIDEYRTPLFYFESVPRNNIPHGYFVYHLQTKQLLRYIDKLILIVE